MATLVKKVLSLLSGLGGNGHIVTCDNVFTSPSLFWELLQDEIYATGLIRTNRKGWPEALTINPSSGEHGQLWYRVHASICMTTITWYDNKPVSLISTACSPIGPSKSSFVNCWHVNNSIEIPSSPILNHY